MNKQQSVLRRFALCVAIIMAVACLGVALAACSPTGTDSSTKDYSFTYDSTTDSYKIDQYRGTETTLTIPNTYENKLVTGIGYRAFRDCKMTSLTVPDSITYISNEAFTSCDNLTTVNWNATACSYAGSYSIFYNCSNLSTVIIGDNVASIPAHAFEDCRQLTSVTIGTGLTTIGFKAFDKCDNLQSVYITDLAKWCGISFYGSYDNPIAIANDLYLDGQLVTNLVIPDSVTRIEDYAFYNYRKLTSLTISKSVTSIGDYAFSNCQGLTSLTISNNVTSIGDYAFSNCIGLTSLTIPDNVISIGKRAFQYCQGLTDVTVGNGVTSIGDFAFYGCFDIATATIPTIAIDYIASARLETVIIRSGTRISDYAFRVCKNLKSITIPDSVESIDAGAFQNCLGLTSIIIPDSVMNIGQGAFFGCRNLTDVFYKGSAEKWVGISIDNRGDSMAQGNYYFTNAARYYYSEEEPQTDGNYWHYVDGAVVVWTKQS